jgi:(hydroxyamino)benzene mutase
MKSRQIDHSPKTFILVFETGDELAKGLLEFAKQEKLSAASFKGENTQRRLIWHGSSCSCSVSLRASRSRISPTRMGLAAHLEGVMNGIFLVALGSAWTKVRLSPPAQSVAFWTTLYGAYANWVMTGLAAVFGTKALSPITGTSQGGQPWQETLVTVGLMSVGVAIVAGTVIILWGLRRDSQKA